MKNNPLSYPERPQIYVYEAFGQPGLKIGETRRIVKSGKDYDAVIARIKEQHNIKTPKPPYKVLWYEPAVTKQGEYFGDTTVHNWLKKFGVQAIRSEDGKATEFYDTDLETIKAVIQNIKNGTPEKGNIARKNYKMRPEQKRAVAQTAAYFQQHLRPDGSSKTKHTPHYLWNAKMRFGKTFAAYQLAKKMGWKRILVLTYKPGVEREWRSELYGHEDFEDWQFIEGLQSWEEAQIDESRPVVWFASYQDVLGRNAGGDLKERHKKMRAIEWDCLFVDEYHFGAWRDSAKELHEADDKKEGQTAMPDSTDEIEETMPLQVRGYLYLSGTPFQALANGEFNEDQIFNWTYADEQRAKLDWRGPGDNPYRELPQIVMLTYQMPEKLREVAMQGEFDEFDLNKFFSAKQNADGEYVFELEKYVCKFLNILHGSDLQIEIDNKFDFSRPALPYEDARLLATLRHTFWFLPTVAACRAMERLLKLDPFFRNYTIIRAAGGDTPGSKKAKEPVELAIGDGETTKPTITLSCGKLTTGVTVPAWSGVLFLRNIERPETYFQTAFRAQSPWTMRDLSDPMRYIIKKPTCYVIDFAPSRALRLIADYSNTLGGVNDARRPEQRLGEFLEFLPILCFDGAKMRMLKAAEILDISTYGTTSTMLARRWQSARLVDTTTVVLEKVLNNPEIMAALEKIEGFRNLRGDLEKVITCEKAIHAARKQRAEEDREATEAELAEEKAAEKECRSFKKKFREKVLQFVTRIPVFMYLTDYREEALIDVIHNLEPKLFIKATGLTVSVFDQMCEVGALNQTELNDAIAQFRRLEDASLTYIGGRSAHDGDEKIGLFDTVVTRDEMDEIIEAEIR